MRRKKTQKIKELEAGLRELPQRSDEWFTARIGRLTASRIGMIMPGKRVAYLSSRADLMDEMRDEILHEKRDVGDAKFPFAVIQAMKWGNDNEDAARAAYELETGNLVEEVGLYLDPQNSRIAASPDGLLMGEPIGLEIKCPFGKKKHDALVSLLEDDVPRDDPKFIQAIDSGYRWQMLCQMECMGVDRVDFVSFDPRRHEAERIIIVPFQRDQVLIDQMIEEADIFLKELDIQVEKRRKLRNGK